MAARALTGNCAISINVWLAGCVTLTATGDGAAAAHTTLGVITQVNRIWPVRVARAPF